MSAETEAAKTLIEVLNGAPVLVQALAFVVILTLFLVAIAKPLSGVVKQVKSDREDEKKGSIDSGLYERMQAQIDKNGEDIKVLIKEKNEWQAKYLQVHEESIGLRTRVERLEELEKQNLKLTAKLDVKDEEIKTKDEENRLLRIELTSLKDRIHELELRLTGDEQRFCMGCAKATT